MCPTDVLQQVIQTTYSSDFTEKYRVLRRFRLETAERALVRHFGREAPFDGMAVEQHVHYDLIKSSVIKSFRDSLFC